MWVNINDENAVNSHFISVANPGEVAAFEGDLFRGLIVRKRIMVLISLPLLTTEKNLFFINAK